MTENLLNATLLILWLCTDCSKKIQRKVKDINVLLAFRLLVESFEHEIGGGSSIFKLMK